MSNNKPPEKRKRNHVNVNFTDSDMQKIRLVQSANPDMRLDSLIVYSLLKVYGEGFADDYNARYVQALHSRRKKLNDEIEELERKIEEKRWDLSLIEKEIEEVMDSEGKQDG